MANMLISEGSSDVIYRGIRPGQSLATDSKDMHRRVATESRSNGDHLLTLYKEKTGSDLMFGLEHIDGVVLPYVIRNANRYVSVATFQERFLSRYPYKISEDLQNVSHHMNLYATQFEVDLLSQLSITYPYETSHTQRDGRPPIAPPIVSLLIELRKAIDFYKSIKNCFPGVGKNLAVEADVLPGGWLFVNSTMIPYIHRRVSTRLKEELLPLSVLEHGAGLQAHTNIQYLKPTECECLVLTNMCKAVNIDFTFPKETILIRLQDFLAPNRDNVPLRRRNTETSKNDVHLDHATKTINTRLDNPLKRDHLLKRDITDILTMTNSNTQINLSAIQSANSVRDVHLNEKNFHPGVISMNIQNTVVPPTTVPPVVELNTDNVHLNQRTSHYPADKQTTGDLHVNSVNSQADRIPSDEQTADITSNARSRSTMLHVSEQTTGENHLHGLVLCTKSVPLNEDTQINKVIVPVVDMNLHHAKSCQQHAAKRHKRKKRKRKQRAFESDLKSGICDKSSKRIIDDVHETLAEKQIDKKSRARKFKKLSQTILRDLPPPLIPYRPDNSASLHEVHQQKHSIRSKGYSTLCSAEAKATDSLPSLGEYVCDINNAPKVYQRRWLWSKRPATPPPIESQPDNTNTSAGTPSKQSPTAGITTIALSQSSASTEDGRCDAIDTGSPVTTPSSTTDSISINVQMPELNEAAPCLESPTQFAVAFGDSGPYTSGDVAASSQSKAIPALNKGISHSALFMSQVTSSTQSSGMLRALHSSEGGSGITRNSISVAALPQTTASTYTSQTNHVFEEMLPEMLPHSKTLTSKTNKTKTIANIKKNMTCASKVIPNARKILTKGVKSNKLKNFARIRLRQWNDTAVSMPYLVPHLTNV